MRMLSVKSPIINEERARGRVGAWKLEKQRRIE